MSQQATLTAFDGSVVPEEHQFVGDSVLREDALSTIALYVERNPLIPLMAQNRVTTKRKVFASGVTRNSVRVEFPTMEGVTVAGTVDGYTAGPKVAYVDTVEIVTIRHPRSTEVGTRRVRQVALNLAGNITTSVGAAIAGQIVEVLDASIMPS